MLDVKDANEKIIYLINSLNYEHSNKNDYIKILENIGNSDSDDDSDNEDSDNEDSDNENSDEASN